jgi:hypothetical protein
MFGEHMRRALRNGLALAILLAPLGCDAFVKAQVRVVSSKGEGIPDALLRLQGATDHDLARFTDAEGCAHFSGVVGPARQVSVSVGKPGFESSSFRLSAAREECLVIHLAQEGRGQSTANRLAADACPCDAGAGYSPSMSARFKVTDTDGTPVELVGVRRSDRPRNQWSQVSDSNGCLGVRWIVPAGLTEIPLVLEKAGYQPVTVEVPIKKDRCYRVSLSREDTGPSSGVVVMGDDACACAMFTGKTVWPEE